MRIFSQKKYIFSIAMFAVAFFAMCGISHAATNDTWTGGGADNNWNTSGNWSSGVPGSSNIAVFSASSTKDCTINTNANVAGISITSGYTGGSGSTITQNTGDSVTMGTSGFSQAAGTFVGSSGTDAITINSGNFTLTGGSFTSTAGTLSIYASSTTFTSGFQPNGGTVFMEWIFNGSARNLNITGSSTFYNLIWANPTSGGGMTLATGTVLTVSSTMSINGNGQEMYFNGGGEADVYGNLNVGNMDHVFCAPSGGCGGTITIGLKGTATQTITASTTANESYLPSVLITKASGSVNISGVLYTTGNWTNTNGTTISPGSSSVLLADQCANQNITITGSSTFNNLTLADCDNGGGTITIATGTLLVASGTLSIGYPGSNSSLYFAGGGEVDAYGNVNINTMTYCGPGSCGGSVTLGIKGTGTQTLTGLLNTGVTSYAPNPGDEGAFPNILITKTSGSVDLAGAFAISGNWTNTNSTAVSPATSTVQFFSPVGGSTLTISGSSTFYILTLEDAGNGNGYYQIATGTDLTVQNQLWLGSGYGYDFGLTGGGEVDAYGNIYADAGYCGTVCGGTATVGITGTSTQLITGVPTGDVAYFPNLKIAKPSGEIQSVGSYGINGNLVLSSGEFQLQSNTSSVAVVAQVSSSITTVNPDAINIKGSITVSAGAVLSEYASASSTITLGSNITNNGLVLFDGSGSGCLSPLQPSYTILRSTVNGTQRTWSGTGTFILRYTDLKDQATTVPITVVNGVNTGNNTPVSGAGWTFGVGPRETIIQSATNAGSGSTLALPQFGFWPKDGDLVAVAVSARNQSITAPTDDAGNTYTLIASSTFGSDSVALYYAKNIVSSSTFIVTANGGGGSSPLLSASAFEYIDMNPSTTVDMYTSNTDNSGTATTLTSGNLIGHDANETYIGAMSLAASTTASAATGAGWTSELGTTNNTADQALYVEDIDTSSSILTLPATWTTPSSTSYGAIAAVFHSPYTVGYAVSGTLDSATFDTGVASGTQLNSLVWQGNAPASTTVDFQIAVSNSSSGPWTFEGPGGLTTAYFTGNPATPISLGSNNSGYLIFNGYRYYRYRITLWSDPDQLYSPTVTGVTVNWSP